MVCEAFGCVPSVARRELEETNPHGYVWRILGLRAYRDTKRAIDCAKSIDDEPGGKMAEQVNATMHRFLKHKQQHRAEQET